MVDKVQGMELQPKMGRKNSKKCKVNMIGRFDRKTENIVQTTEL